LHEFLEVGKDFSTWIKDRVEQYDFVENQDFVIDSPILGNQNSRGGDRKSKEYHLTIDMAKELSMVERNAKGKQARQYFIECEKQAKQPQQQSLASPKKEALSIAPAALDVAKAFGFAGNIATIAANSFVRKATGVDILADMGQPLLANPAGVSYTPTELGKQLSPVLSAIKTNQLLQANGYQDKDATGAWTPTTKAAGLYAWIDAPRKHTIGSEKQLRWFSGVLSEITSHANN
jgi:phage anti-repressor protein